MMKKFVVFLMSLVMFTTISSTSRITAHAAAIEASTSEIIVSETTEYYDDGTYATVIVSEETSPTTRATAYTKTGNKAYVLYNKNREELWRFTVHGTFSVNSGVSSTCTAVSHSISITENAWQNESASTSRSGNQAIGDATFIKKLLFITVETKGCHVVLTCDKNGNLS